ncbi:MAG: hypothetical protein K6G52_00670 [Treponemataceae bacterium]|nr:hypothetical protein [Treponemataceae bacterium]
MRKFLAVFSVCLAFVGFNLFSQDFVDAKVAQRQTALRYSLNAKNFIEEEDYSSAISQVDLGLAYDDEISDLWYAKAYSLRKTDGNLNQIYECAKKAYELNDWKYFQSDSCLVLYADVLADTNRNEMAFNLLEGRFSSDIEFIRAKTCYNTGDVVKARSIISSATKVFPDDTRFSNLFFKSEYNNYFFNGEQLDSASIQIASNFISKIQKISQDYPDVIFYASFFVQDPNFRNRLLRQFFAENSMKVDFLHVAMQNSMIAQDNALTLFLSFLEKPVNSKVFEKTVAQFTDADVKENLMVALADFSGTLTFDFTGDFTDDFCVSYVDGRPELISADLNQDYIVDYRLYCDFGVPTSVEVVSSNSLIKYDSYPAASTICIEENTLFSLIDGAYKWMPVSFVEKALFEGFNFYFAYPTQEKIVQVSREDYTKLLSNSSSVVCSGIQDGKTYEKVFTMKNGYPIEILYKMDGVIFGKSLFTDGNLSVRYIDRDLDSIFEIAEYFEFDEDNPLSKEETIKNLYEDLFGTIPAQKGLYPSKIAIDYDGNEIYDCVETFFADGSRVVWYEGYVETYVFEKHTLKDGTVNEKFELLNPANSEKITLISKNGVPVKLSDRFEDLDILFDEEHKIYFIDEIPADNIAEEISNHIKTFPDSIFHRSVWTYQDEEGYGDVLEFVIVRVGENYFAQKHVNMND